MKQDTISELPLKVLVPWCIILLLAVIGWCWVACDMAEMNEEMKIKQKYQRVE